MIVRGDCLERWSYYLFCCSLPATTPCWCGFCWWCRAYYSGEWIYDDTAGIKYTLTQYVIQVQNHFLLFQLSCPSIYLPAGPAAMLGGEWTDYCSATYYNLNCISLCLVVHCRELWFRNADFLLPSPFHAITTASFRQWHMHVLVCVLWWTDIRLSVYSGYYGCPLK